MSLAALQQLKSGRFRLLNVRVRTKRRRNARVGTRSPEIIPKYVREVFKEALHVQTYRTGPPKKRRALPCRGARSLRLLRRPSPRAGILALACALMAHTPRCVLWMLPTAMNRPRAIATSSPILNTKWRVIECRDWLQWILQSRDTLRPLPTAVWRGRSYCRSKEALLRVSAAHGGAIDPTAAAILTSLAERIDDGKFSNGEDPATATPGVAAQ